MFQWDSPLMRILRTVTNYIFVTILTVVCSIPLITCGAALCAGYDTVRRNLIQEQGQSVGGIYFKSFARNFRQSTVIWLICAAVCVVFWQGIRVLEALGYTGAASGVLQGVLVLGMVVCLAVLLCALASTARFKNTVALLLKNSLLLCVMNLWRILILLVVLAVCVFIVWYCLPLILIVPALFIFYWCRCMEKIFAPHLHAGEEDKP